MTATLENNLMFAGHNAYRFGQDPFYSNGFVPEREAAGRPHPDRSLNKQDGGRDGRIPTHRFCSLALTRSK